MRPTNATCRTSPSPRCATARANDRTFPKPVGKRGAELLYRVGDLKKWAHNRPRAASGTTDLD
ncbi:hypothetical protein QF034_008126 [Streptomyces africanus]|uniref:Transcriptional regulator n=1 Tax=Streptomyces africanus TaxID=231024 RepID=A0ABU0R3K3_9ACTN|nr:hypothetical protein [Streptomyces africanus]MDQ0753895.1 hypothetical protein [Streptomyces africanus]